MGINPEKLGPRYEKLRALADAAGRPCPEVVVIGALPTTRHSRWSSWAVVRRLACPTIQSSLYSTTQEFDVIAARVADLQRQLR